jgi:hypothetical protein
MAWNIAHIASDEALRNAVCSEVRSESDPFARGASVSSMTSAGIAISANKSELPLLDKCMRETNRLFGILLLVREVRLSFVSISGRSICNASSVLVRVHPRVQDLRSANLAKARETNAGIVASKNR